MEQRTKEHTQQVNVKTLEFIKSIINGWFSILETQFHLQNMMTLPEKIVL